MSTFAEAGRPLTTEPSLVPASAALPAGRVLELDGLRGLAVLLVLIHHSLAGINTLSLGRLLPFGWTGVDLFFVLSGFLITRILRHSRDQPGRYRAFYARRARRIWPLYYAFLAVLIAVGPLLPDPARFGREEYPWVWAGLFAQNLAPLAGVVAVPYVLGITWSLAIEEQFYLLWPAAVFRLSRSALIWILAGIALGSPLLRYLLLGHGRSPDFLYYLTATRLDGLAAGALVALLFERPTISPDETRRYGLVALLALVPALTIVYGVLHGERAVNAHQPNEHHLLLAALYSLVALGYGGLLVLALDGRGRVGRLLRVRFLRQMGEISFGLYLIHYPVLEVTRFALAPVFGRLVSSAAATALSMLLGFVVTFLLAVGSWRYFERPILLYRFGKKATRGKEATNVLDVRGGSGG